MVNLNNLFEDKNKNNIPDIMESNNAKVFTSTQFIVDGKSYNSIEEMPPDVKAKFEQSMKNFDQTPLNFGTLTQMINKNSNLLGSSNRPFNLRLNILSFNLISLLFVLIFGGPVAYFFFNTDPESKIAFSSSFISYQISIILIATAIPFILNYFSLKKTQDTTNETGTPVNNSMAPLTSVANNFTYSTGKYTGIIFLGVGIFLFISTYITQPDFFTAIQNYWLKFFSSL